MIKKTLAAALVAALVSGCAEAEREDTPETLNERRGAWRQACAAQEIAARAAEDVTTIEQVLGDIDPADPLAGISRTASEAALEFARAYAAHADIRASAYAYLDSAVNHSQATADSARYMDRAAGIAVRTPQPGTLEENVLVSYQQNFVAILQNGDHRCNWDVPF